MREKRGERAWDRNHWVLTADDLREFHLSTSIKFLFSLSPPACAKIVAASDLNSTEIVQVEWNWFEMSLIQTVLNSRERRIGSNMELNRIIYGIEFNQSHRNLVYCTFVFFFLFFFFVGYRKQFKAKILFLQDRQGENSV